MDTADRLIEYYFQRKINGMDDEEIQKSLEEQFMEDEDRKLIYNQVLYKEMLYRKALARRKTARVGMLIGLGLILSSMMIYLITYFKGDFPFSLYLFYSLLSLGFITFMGGMVISRR